MSGAHSGRRPELRDETPKARSPQRVPRREILPADDGPGRPDRREEMNSETANAPAPAEEGRCASCGEEILPVPT